MSAYQIGWHKGYSTGITIIRDYDHDEFYDYEDDCLDELDDLECTLEYIQGVKKGARAAWTDKRGATTVKQALPIPLG